MKSKSPEKEEEIYRVVLEITSEVGLVGLKMSNIAKRAGLAHGTVYIYFKNKKHLVNQLFKKAKNRAHERLIYPSATGGDYFMNLKQFWKSYILYLIDNQKETHFIRQCMESPFLEKESKAVSDKAYQRLHDFFEKGKVDRYIKSMDTELLMSVFSGLAKEVVEKINAGTLEKNDVLIEDSFELCWNAIRR